MPFGCDCYRCETYEQCRRINSGEGKSSGDDYIPALDRESYAESFRNHTSPNSTIPETYGWSKKEYLW